ncbi:MAG: hypothetical protein ACRDPD_01410, partial [Streptosporangiaceae bacterium]
DKIREIERLNPGKKVILAPIDPGPEAGAAAALSTQPSVTAPSLATLRGVTPLTVISAPHA